MCVGKYWPHLVETKQNRKNTCYRNGSPMGTECIGFMYTIFWSRTLKKTSYKCCITYHLLPVSCYISILTTAIKIPATLECSLPILPNVFGHLFGPRNTSIGDGCVSIFEKQKGLGPQFFYIIHIYIYIYLYIQYLSTYIIIYIIQMYTCIYILQYNVFKTTKNNSPNHHR